MRNILEAVNKNDLKLLLQDKLDCTGPQALDIINAFQDIILEQIQNEKSVHLGKIGKIFLKHKAQRMGMNPKMNEPMVIIAKKAIAFKMFPGVNKLLNKKPE